MNPYRIEFSKIDATDLNRVGGKGLNLGKLSSIPGIHVPPGFVLTTDAYLRALQDQEDIQKMLEALEKLNPQEWEKIATLSSELRLAIAAMSMPEEIEEVLEEALSRYDEDKAFAVRSSATAEDLPDASFAGQQDSFLNVRGKDAVLEAVKKCWASLFTERAIVYRMQQGFHREQVLLAVVIQEMILSEVSGIMFTADPMTSDRKTMSIDAGFGLGEAMVSGVTNPDIYRLRDGKILSRSFGKQDVEIQPLEAGGTIRQEVSALKRQGAALQDEEILELHKIGRRIEADFGSPQDIEWCYREGQFYIVQSRGITTLFPIPQSFEKGKPRVYVSIGHIQMMTDALRPLGMSFFEMISEIKLTRVGGRAFADATHDLSSAIGRKRLLMATGKQDLLIQGALQKLLQDEAFSASLPRGKRNIKGGIFTLGSLWQTLRIRRKNNPAMIDEIIQGFEKELSGIDATLSKLSPKQALDFIREDRERLLAGAYHPKMLGAIIAAILASDAIDKNIEQWLGEKQAADSLSKSLQHNITTDMGLALCDLADLIREEPEVLQYLSDNPSDEEFFTDLGRCSGGEIIAKAFKQFFLKYGMRCPGEIDITRARFEEKPTQLLPMLLNNVEILKAGEHVERFRAGEREAVEKEKEFVSRLLQLPGGEKKARRLRRDISVMRNFLGCREYPKYYIVRRYQIYKKALLRTADVLVKRGVLKDREDLFYLYFDEVYQLLGSRTCDQELIDKRKKEYSHVATLTPPRVITSEGYVPQVELSAEDYPKEALLGIPVSSGLIEGRARVILSVEDADLEAGDILVTRFTDPSWTPLFATIKGLVTEVGGFTTHGAVVAREYGLPCVVGVEHATQVIQDGQMIRLHGSKGYVELL